MPHIKYKERKKISLRQRISQGKKYGGACSREALFHALCKAGKEMGKGAMTLEAALVFPLFFFAVVTILSLFLMMQAQYIVGNALDAAVADTALLRQKPSGEVKTLAKAAFYKELAAQKCPFSLIKGGIAGFSWKGTSVDETYIDAVVTYRIRFPISYFGKREIKVSDERRIHRWVGMQEGGTEGKQELWVFVTPNQSVYHENRNCTHLRLSVKSVGAAAVKSLRGSYMPCAHCTKGQKMGNTVYVTEEGDCYHYSIGCSGLKRTIYMVKRSQAAGKRPCSRCGK